MQSLFYKWARLSAIIIARNRMFLICFCVLMSCTVPTKKNNFSSSDTTKIKDNSVLMEKNKSTYYYYNEMGMKVFTEDPGEIITVILFT